MANHVDEYILGQRDLISHVKEEVLKIMDESKGEDLYLDLMNLMTTLKPVEKRTSVLNEVDESTGKTHGS